MESVDSVIIGAGVMGLAMGRALALVGHSPLILEQNPAFGMETSSRNSEVIHAGLYYPEGSLKAACCVEGKHLLYDYCKARHIPFSNCGKLIVATSRDQEATLESLQAKGKRHGVHDLKLLTAHEATSLEPNLSCVAALHSPSTGIVDSHAYMLALLTDAEADGALLVPNTRVKEIQVENQGFTVHTINQAGESYALHTPILINAAGLHASDVAHYITGLSTAHIPDTRYARGVYFTLSGRAPFQHLIYPVPEPGGLGVHLTLDLGGQARFGPDVEWIDEIDYTVDPTRGDKFYDAIRTYWPALPDDSLSPGYAGIRPKISMPGDPAADFMVSGPSEHGLPGLINLFGIESPGLTASLSLAQRVLEKL